MQTNQMFPDVSYERRSKIKEKKKLNSVILFPDISSKIRSDIAFNQKPFKERFTKPHFLKSSDSVENKNLKWYFIIITLAITLFIYFKTFSFEI